MTSKSKKLTISKRALLQRINRRLAKDNEQIKACRSERWRHEVGDFFRIDVHRNAVIDKQIDLEKLGRELEVLKPWEAVETEE